MPTISKLSAIITADVKQFVSGLAEAENKSKEFVVQLKESGDFFKDALGAIGVGFSIDGLAELVKSSFEVAESQTNMARTLGISTEAMSRLDYAGKIVAVSNEDISTSIARMTKNLIEAQRGSSAVSDAFDHLGIKVKDLQSLKPDEAFMKLSDSIKNVPNKIERLADAQEIFGRGAVKIMPLLSQGAEGMKELGIESDKLGFTLNSIDAEKLEEGNRAMKQIGAATSVIGRELAVAVVPAVQWLADHSKEIISNLKFAMKEFTPVGAIFQMSDAYHKLKGDVGVGHKIAEDLDAAGEAAAEANGKIRGMLAGIDKQLQQFGMSDLQKKLDDLAEAGATRAQIIEAQWRLEAVAFQKQQDALGKAIDEVRAKWSESILTFKEMNVARFESLGASPDVAYQMAALLDQIKAHKEAAEAAANAQREQMEQQKRAMEELANQAHEVWESTRTGAEKYAEQIEKLNQLLLLHKLGLGGIDQDTFDRAAIKAQSLLDNKPSPLAGTFEAGSQAAARYVAEFSMGRGNDDMQQQLLQTARDGNTKAGKLIEEVQKVAKDIASNFAFVTGF